MATSKWEAKAASMEVEYLAPDLPAYGESHSKKDFDFAKWSEDAERSDKEADRLNRLASAGILEDFPCMMIGIIVSKPVEVRTNVPPELSDEDIAAKLARVEDILGGADIILPGEELSAESESAESSELSEESEPEIPALSAEDVKQKLAKTASFLSELGLEPVLVAS